MRNFRSQSVRTFTAPSDVTSGVPVLIGTRFVIPQHDADSGEPFSAIYEGVVELDKLGGAGLNFTAGQDVFFSTSSLACTPRANNPRIGVSPVIVAAEATTMEVVLPGFDAVAKPAVLQPLGELPFTDSDTAAADGRQVFLVQSPEGTYLAANIEAAANGSIPLTDGDIVLVKHNADPAANLGGVALYFDEDATRGARLMMDSAWDVHGYISTLGGKLIKVEHRASPGTAGVACYYDSGAASAATRLQFVSPTDASGVEETCAGRSDHAAYNTAA